MRGEAVNRILTIVLVTVGACCFGIAGALFVDYMMQPPPTQTLYIAFDLDGTRTVQQQSGITALRTIEGPLSLCVEATMADGALLGICDVQAWVLE